jgi:hypothetical protein
VLKCKQQEKLRDYLEKRERGELLVQKTARLYETFLAPSQLSARSTYVAFDQAIQLIACDMPNIHSTMNGPLALSVVVNEPHINRCQEIDQHCDVTCAPSPRPMARNTFIVRARPQRHRSERLQSGCNEATNSQITATGYSPSDCQYLKYGEDFALECYESRQKPLMVYSAPKSPLAADRGDFVFKSHGEMKQSVGLARLESGEMSAKGREPSIPSNFFHWRLLHVNPDCRFETIGESIPVSERGEARNILSFIMVSVKSQRLL